MGDPPVGVTIIIFGEEDSLVRMLGSDCHYKVDDLVQAPSVHHLGVGFHVDLGVDGQLGLGQ